MKIHLERLRQPQLGVTLVECPEALLNLFPQRPAHPAPPFSVLLVDGDIPSEGDLLLDAARLTAITIGAPGYALLIGRSGQRLDPANLDEPPEAAPGVRPAIGDLEFLAEADARLKDEQMRRDLRALVEHVRTLAPHGTLRSAPSGFGRRRYTNVPDNFVGFTIRNQAVLVHARRSGAARASKFKIAAERRPFIRFRLRSADDVLAALPLIEASWRRGA